VSDFAYSLIFNPENNMNLRCCGKKRRYREFLQQPIVEHRPTRESAMTFGGEGTQTSRISLVVPELEKSQTQR
jgi:hypothetical protein